MAVNATVLDAVTLAGTTVNTALGTMMTEPLVYIVGFVIFAAGFGIIRKFFRRPR